jgi:hypothetical protein
MSNNLLDMDLLKAEPIINIEKKMTSATVETMNVGYDAGQLTGSSWCTGDNIQYG